MTVNLPEDVTAALRRRAAKIAEQTDVPIYPSSVAISILRKALHETP